MKKAVAGVLLSLVLCAGHEAFAAFPSFVASAMWSSDLRPDPDYVDETDAEYFESHPDLAAAPDQSFIDGETQGDEEAVDEEVPDEEKPEEEITTPTDINVNDTEKHVVATPDEAGIDIEGLTDEVEGAIEQ